MELQKPSGYSWTSMRSLLRELRNTAERSLGNGEYYRLDRTDAFSYLDHLPRWQRTIGCYLQSLRKRSETVVFVDICGRATLSQAEVNYSFSLQPVEHHWHSKGATPVQGDIFSRHDFPRFLRLIEENGHQPAWVTFDPVAGLGSYYLPCKRDMQLASLHHAIVYKRLVKHLEVLIRILRPGGYIFLGPPFQFMYTVEFFQRVPQEQYAVCLWAKDFCQKHRCSLEINTNPYGPHWLIRKWLK